MSRLGPQKIKNLIHVLEKLGWQELPDRGKGSHRVFEKEGCSRPIIVPDRAEIPWGTFESILRTLGISKNQYASQLKEKKKETQPNDKGIGSRNLKAPFTGKNQVTGKRKRKLAARSRKKNRH
ncbi:MAG: type II toxin-antitoxin system HicA family toxin [Myxococcales bacterium]|nr:type II toxin-antitoxin system HicA family toxin [Myxococcales bacterium]